MMTVGQFFNSLLVSGLTINGIGIENYIRVKKFGKKKYVYYLSDSPVLDNYNTDRIHKDLKKYGLAITAIEDMNPNSSYYFINTQTHDGIIFPIIINTILVFINVKADGTVQEVNLFTTLSNNLFGTSSQIVLLKESGSILSNNSKKDPNWSSIDCKYRKYMKSIGGTGEVLAETKLTIQTLFDAIVSFMNSKKELDAKGFYNKYLKNRNNTPFLGEGKIQQIHSLAKFKDEKLAHAVASILYGD